MVNGSLNYPRSFGLLAVLENRSNSYTAYVLLGQPIIGDHPISLENMCSMAQRFGRLSPRYAEIANIERSILEIMEESSLMPLSANVQIHSVLRWCATQLKLI